RDREPQPAEEPAPPALANVALGLHVRLGPRHADGVEAELRTQPLHLGRCHLVHYARVPPHYDPSVKAIRIHEDGGPEVLRYEDAPDPEPGADEVLVELRAASLNHLDVWIRAGRPSV